jgi:N,N'-diacetyllegionaminate synthase
MDGMVSSIRIRDRIVGEGHPCFIIAEAGVNHNGDPELAWKLVDAAAAAGADAVKFQTFRTGGIMVQSTPKAAYQMETTGSGESQFDMVKRLELPFEEFGRLKDYSEKRGILFLSTPFDFEAVDYLASLDMPAFKLSSGEVTNHPFLAYVARTRKPVILSTGMSTLNEVEEAVTTMKKAGVAALSLLHCVSNYPAMPRDVNLRAMLTMRNAFGVPVGYSDHTLGIEIAMAAVALGASIVEKHFTLDRNLPGPDHRASLQPDELSAMVRSIRNVEQALGHGRKEPAMSEADTAAAARRSLVAACDIPAGTALTEKVIAIKRPGTGMPPSMRALIVGRTAKNDIPAGTVLTLEMFI